MKKSKGRQRSQKLPDHYYPITATIYYLIYARHERKLLRGHHQSKVVEDAILVSLQPLTIYDMI